MPTTTLDRETSKDSEGDDAARIPHFVRYVSVHTL